MEIQALPAIRYKQLPQLQQKRPELAGHGLEFKALRGEIKADFDKRKVTLYIAGFGNIDLGNDLILKGAALQSIEEDFPRDLVKFCWDHEFPLGPAKSLAEDDTGLLMVGSVTPHADFDRYLAQIADGTAAHGSLGYSVRDFEVLTVKQVVERYGVDPGGRPDNMRVRVIKSMRIWEGSAVIWPMNELVRVVGVKNKGIPMMEKKGLWELAEVLKYQDWINYYLSAEWAELDGDEVEQAQELLAQMQQGTKRLADALNQRQTKAVPVTNPETKAAPTPESLSDSDLEAIADLLVDVKSARRGLNLN